MTRRVLVAVLLLVAGCGKTQPIAEKDSAQASNEPAPSASSSAQPPKERAIVFRTADAFLGKVYRTTDRETIDTDLHGGRDKKDHVEKAKERTVTVLDETRTDTTHQVTKLSLAYSAKNEKTSTAGKTYLGARTTGDEFTVTREGGGALSQEEEKEVRKDMKGNFEGELSAILASKPRTVGESMPDFADAMMKKFADSMGKEMHVSDVTVVLTKVETVGGKEFGVFDFHATMRMDKGAVKMELGFKAQLRVRVDDLAVGDGTMGGDGVVTGAMHGTMKFALETKTELVAP